MATPMVTSASALADSRRTASVRFMRGGELSSHPARASVGPERSALSLLSRPPVPLRRAPLCRVVGVAVVARLTTEPPPSDAPRFAGDGRAALVDGPQWRRNPLFSQGPMGAGPNRLDAGPGLVLLKMRQSAPRLLNGYLPTLCEILAEIDDTQKGDLVIFSVYVLEPGQSTRDLLAALRHAARRGVRLHLSVDASKVSSFTRWCEGTRTCKADLQQLEEDYPALVSFHGQTMPTHAKYLICHRPRFDGATSSAIFGGINIGDRFTAWEDFAVRIEGDSVVGALARSLGIESLLQPPSPSFPHDRVVRPVIEVVPAKAPATATAYTNATAAAAAAAIAASPEDRLHSALQRQWTQSTTAPPPPPPPPPPAINFVTNQPQSFTYTAMCLGRAFPGCFDVAPCLRAFFADAHYASYTVAMAYMDRHGAKMVRVALERGAKVRMVMPQHPNVYEDCNNRALHELLTQFPHKLRVFICPDMIHAKAIIGHLAVAAEGAAGAGAAEGAPMAGAECILGSCNLKNRSFNQFTELNAHIHDGEFVAALAASIERLIDGSERVHAVRFRPVKAQVEEWLG